MLGEVDDVLIAEIMRTGATTDELAAACAWVANDEPSITAPMKFVKSRTSPIPIVGTSRSSPARTSGQRFDGM